MNGYSIICELRERGVKPIWLLDNNRSLASFSRRIDGFLRIGNDPRSLLEALRKLSSNYRKLVVYPTNDVHLEDLYAIHDEISAYCFLPYNRDNLLSALDKKTQYDYCDKLNVPHPCSIELNTPEDIPRLAALGHPIIIRPRKRDDLRSDVFRNLLLTSVADIERHATHLTQLLERGVSLLASEVIPGDDANIHAYVAYRSASGKILDEWIGRKLNQFPDGFGVFSSASNEAPEIVRELGRRLVDGMDLHGIVQPEFKFDPRDGKFKLMEINLRSMMWHRLGNRTGVFLQHAQWMDAQGQPVERTNRQCTRRIHLVYLKHECGNLLSRRGYFRQFTRNLFGGDQRSFVVLDYSDPGPMVRDLLSYFRYMAGALLLRWKRRASDTPR